MASMKKVMFGALFFFVAFELISCIPVVNFPQPNFIPFSNCIDENQSPCMAKGKFSTYHAVFQFLLFFFSLLVYSLRFLNKFLLFILGCFICCSYLLKLFLFVIYLLCKHKVLIGVDLVFSFFLIVVKLVYPTSMNLTWCAHFITY